MGTLKWLLILFLLLPTLSFSQKAEWDKYFYQEESTGSKYLVNNWKTARTDMDKYVGNRKFTYGHDFWIPKGGEWIGSVNSPMVYNAYVSDKRLKALESEVEALKLDLEITTELLYQVTELMRYVSTDNDFYFRRPCPLVGE